MVTPSKRLAPITGTQQRSSVRSANPPRQRRTRPRSRKQRRLRQVRAHQPLDETEPQKRAQPFHEVPRRADRHDLGRVQHRGRHVARGQTGKPTVRRQTLHEPLCRRQVKNHRARRQPPLGEQIALKARQQHIRRRARHRRLLGRQHPEPAEHVEQAPQPRTRPMGAAAPLRALPDQELIDTRAIQLRDGQPTRRKPATQPRHLPKLVHRRTHRIAACSQLHPIRVRERGQQPRHQHPRRMTTIACVMPISIPPTSQRARSSLPRSA